MNAPRRRSDSIAEAAIIAIVVIVLGVAATTTRLDPMPEYASAATVDELAAKVRMQMPIAGACLGGREGEMACGARVASNGRN